MLLGGSTHFWSQEIDMNPMDTMACFSDSKMLNNFVNNKAIEKIKKFYKHSIHYPTVDYMTILKFVVDVPSLLPPIALDLNHNFSAIHLALFLTMFAVSVSTYGRAHIPRTIQLSLFQLVDGNDHVT